MRKGRTLNLGVAGVRTKAEEVSVFVNRNGVRCGEDEATKTLVGEVQLVASVKDLDTLINLFGSSEHLLTFAIAKINSMLKANAINSLIAAHQGPDKAIAEFAEKLRKAGVPEAEIEVAISAIRSTVSAASR